MKRPWVIKAGGEMLASDSSRKKILRDLKKWHRKHPIVFVHGGGPQIEEELVKANVPIQFIEGRRVTSAEVMVVVERVLSGQINKGIVGELVADDVLAVGLSCRDAGLITGVPIAKLGRAARPEKVNTAILLSLLDKGFLPVVSSVGSDRSGAAVNINADDAASAIACALKAENLVFLTDISGVMDKYKKRIPKLRKAEVDQLIQAGVIKGGMIPKVQSATAALLKGVSQVNITDGFRGVDFGKGTTIVR